MFQVRPVLLLLALLSAAVWYWRHSYAMETQQDTSGTIAAIEPIPGPKRIAAARAARGKVIAKRCRDAGLPYPPRELFLRVFKKEAQLEAWGREDKGPFRQIGVFSITVSSGQPGPKRREGDLQVPEGCYRIVTFNPESRFHLSLGLDYPNASDKVLSDQEKPGFDIYIHGGAVSVGCVPLGDEVIEEVYLLANDVKARSQVELPVHIFPMRMEGPEWEAMQAASPEHATFWKQLEPIYASFERNRKVPIVEVQANGVYRLK